MGLTPDLLDLYLPVSSLSTLVKTADPSLPVSSTAVPSTYFSSQHLRSFKVWGRLLIFLSACLPSAEHQPPGKKAFRPLHSLQCLPYLDRQQALSK